MHFLRPGGFQHPGGFTRRGAGGQDVVQQQYPLSGNLRAPGQPVDAQHICPAFRLAVNAGLRAVVTDFRRRGIGVIPSSRPTAFASSST